VTSKKNEVQLQKIWNNFSLILAVELPFFCPKHRTYQKTATGHTFLKGKSGQHQPQKDNH